MLRRLHSEQPESFAFTDANRRWAEAQIKKYPEGRQASAIIPLLWRAQEQEGWLSRPAIEHVADMLGLAYIRALEVATFYFMFQLQPVGSVAHVQVCGTLSCMICGAEDLIGVCKDKIAPRAHALSADGRFSWEEVECLGACANAPMVQIGKDYYEDLTVESFAGLLDRLAAGEVPVPGPQNGRYASEPKSGLTSLKEWEADRNERNASAALATDIGDTIRRIDGTEVPLVAPWVRDGGADEQVPSEAEAEAIEQSHPGPRPAEGHAADSTGVTEQEAEAASRAKPRSMTDPAGEKADETDPGVSASGSAGSDETGSAAASDRDEPDTAGTPSASPTSGAAEGQGPERLDAPRGEADNLKRISGIGPKIEGMLNEMGIWHFSQIAAWGPAEVAWVDSRLNFRGRIEREGWVEQAKSLQS